ncbi:hypothetical protein Droror1_Dr00017079 [Drosera rotundifolia]
MNESVGSSPELKRSAAADDDPGKSSAQSSELMRLGLSGLAFVDEEVDCGGDILMTLSCSMLGDNSTKNMDVWDGTRPKVSCSVCAVLD